MITINDNLYIIKKMLAPKYIEQNIISSVCQFERFKSHRERV